MVKIHFKKIDHPNWKYELEESYTRQLLSTGWNSYKLFKGQTGYNGDFLELTIDDSDHQFRYGGLVPGLFLLLTSVSGYRWDGCSGPTVDTQTNMRAGLVHDSLYQLMRLGLLPQSARVIADREFLLIMKEDGMNWFRRTYYYWSVRLFARKYAKKV